MDLKVIGRHALFFDDDRMASFVNSIDALVIWNSIPIDRYDVRHLLTTPPSSRRSFRRHGSSSPPLFDSSLQSDLDHQRFMDLPTPGEPDLQCDDPLKVEDSYHKVGFSYTGSDPHTSSASAPDTGTGFLPPFPLPPALLGHTPDSEKMHQIIARTALFVQRQGVQSEFVLRVKQGDNPKFGFLAPSHHLHPYFRHLVDNRLLLAMIPPEKPPADVGGGSATSALSLLGSVYGSIEDENRGSSMSADDVYHTELQLETTGKDEWDDPFEVKGSSYYTALKTEKGADLAPELKNAAVGRIVKGHTDEMGIIDEATKRRRLHSNQDEKSRILEARNPKGGDDTGLPSKKTALFLKRGGVFCEKGKVKMVTRESGNRGLSIGPQATSPRADFGVSVDATAAAAILRAATGGSRNPGLSISLPGTCIDPTAGIRSEPSKVDPDRPTKEQKLKSERLKKAKMFLLGLNSSDRVSVSARDMSEPVRERTRDRSGSAEGRGVAEEERGKRGKRRRKWREEQEEGEMWFKERGRRKGDKLVTEVR